MSILYNKVNPSVLVIGGTRGIGKEIVDYFNGDSVSRANGYNIDERTSRSGIADKSLEYDIVVNNIRDAKTDIKTGKKTLAVKFGIPFSKIEYSILVTLPFILVIILFYEINDLGIFLTFFSFPISINLVKRIFLDKGSALNDVLAKTARFLVVFSLLLFLGLIL